MSPHRPVEGRGRALVGVAAIVVVGLLLAALCGRPAAVTAPPTPSTPAPEAQRTAAPPEDPLPASDPADADQDATPDPDPDDPHATSAAICRVSPALPEASGALILGDGLTPPYNARPIAITDGGFRMPMVGGLGAGVLAIEGYAPTAILWSSAGPGRPPTCAPDPIRLEVGEAWVSGAVRTTTGAAVDGATVQGCGALVGTDGDGQYAMSVRPGRCVLDAYRRDGAILAHADPAEVTAVVGAEQQVDFVLPDGPRAGIGIRLARADGGMRIASVVPGSAADLAGIGPGDVISAIDGTDASELSVQEFVDLALGADGTEVRVTVRPREPDGDGGDGDGDGDGGDGDGAAPREVVLVRRPIGLEPR